MDIVEHVPTSLASFETRLEVHSLTLRKPAANDSAMHQTVMTFNIFQYCRRGIGIVQPRLQQAGGQEEVVGAAVHPQRREHVARPLLLQTKHRGDETIAES